MKTYMTPYVEEVKFATEAIADQGGTDVSGEDDGNLPG